MIKSIRKFGNVRETIELVKLRIKAKEKFSRAVFMCFDEEGLDF